MTRFRKSDASGRADSQRDDSERDGSERDAGDADVVVVPITETFDLHDFHPREIPEIVDAYLEAADEKGFRDLRIIHGRGKGVQRARVQALLADHPRVASFADAPADRGGWGATLVRLRDRTDTD